MLKLELTKATIETFKYCDTIGLWVCFDNLSKEIYYTWDGYYVDDVTHHRRPVGTVHKVGYR